MAIAAREVEARITAAVVEAAAPEAAYEIARAIMQALTTDLIGFADMVGLAFTSQAVSPDGFGEVRIPFKGLTPETIRRKHGDDTFFHDTGALQASLEANLPGIMARMFDVHVRVSTAGARPRVFFSVFAGNLAPDFMTAALATGNWRDAGRPEADLSNDLRDKLLYNPRSWLGPALAYWAIVEARRVAGEAVRRVTGK